MIECCGCVVWLWHKKSFYLIVQEYVASTVTTNGEEGIKKEDYFESGVVRARCFVVVMAAWLVVCGVCLLCLLVVVGWGAKSKFVRGGSGDSTVNKDFESVDRHLKLPFS